MPSVLIVDDDKDSREALSRYLARSGYATRSAPNGRLALIAIGTQLPDVVLLDWMMPEMDGIGFLEVIRSYLRWTTLPVILLTGYEGPHIDRAMQLGVKRVFFKSKYTLPELLECVNKLRDDPAADCATAV